MNQRLLLTPTVLTVLLSLLKSKKPGELYPGLFIFNENQDVVSDSVFEVALLAFL